MINIVKKFGKEKPHWHIGAPIVAKLVGQLPKVQLEL